MADHADAPERVAARQRHSALLAFAAVGVAVLGTGGSAGWFGHHGHQVRQQQAQHELYVQIARQAAVNLTSVDYAHADADVQRIVDSATGVFGDDFRERSRAFVDVAKQTQSSSEGDVTEAGLESADGDRAEVLLAVSVRTTVAGTVQPEPRRWRMRISLQRTGDGPKVSNVAFVP